MNREAEQRAKQFRNVPVSPDTLKAFGTGLRLQGLGSARCSPHAEEHSYTSRARLLALPKPTAACHWLATGMPVACSVPQQTSHVPAHSEQLSATKDN
jgi:hypothetical protein